VNKDTRQALALILAFWMPLAPCAQLHAASYVDPANEFAICTNPAWQAYPAIHGSVVMWMDGRNGRSDIYGKDLSTNQEFPICVYLSSKYWPRMYGKIVVWGDWRNGNSDIYGKDLSTGREFPICISPGHQIDQVIYDDIVVWQDGRNGNLVPHNI